MTYETSGDLCLGFWKHAWDSGWCDFPPNAEVLELGCAEADWQTPMLAVRPDLQITGIDWRKITRPGKTIIQGDILQQHFERASFDCIVAVSHVEWVGVNHYGDPKQDEGDRIEMALCSQWLKPGGWMYLDVPHRPNGPDPRAKFRAYTDDMVRERIVEPHFKEVQRRLFSKEEAQNHPDGPYIALLLNHK